MIDEKTLRLLKREYAHLIVKFGVKIKKGDLVAADLALDDQEFNYFLIEECYKAGAKRVLVDYDDEMTDRLHFAYGDSKELSKVYPHQIERYKLYQKEDAVTLHCYSHNLLNTPKVDSKKMTSILKCRREQIFKYYFAYSMHCRWSGFAIPSRAWAKKLFPKLSDELAVNKLWEVIFKCCHIEKNKSVKNWEKHNALLKKRAAWLNSLNIKSLHYTNKLGTDLVVGIIPHSLFHGGTHSVDGKTFYNPNFPTEEVFISPDRDKTNGVVYSSKPLVIDGEVIRDISFKFKNGRIYEVHASSNEQLLKAVLDTDENARYLGEAALVPFTSPINQTGLLFYDTLYDENACCHLAFGFGFPISLPNGNQLNEKELLKAHVNQSKTHIDFMIGTKDLNITAITRDGKKVPIFKNGNWVK